MISVASFMDDFTIMFVVSIQLLHINTGVLDLVIGTCNSISLPQFHD
jgi:hypothetical protein